MRDLSDLLKCDVRRRLVLHLLTAGPTAVTPLGVAIGETQPNTSDHLTQLRRARLVTHRKRGRERLYEPNPALARLERRDGRMYLEVGRVEGTTVRLGVKMGAA